MAWQSWVLYNIQLQSKNHFLVASTILTKLTSQYILPIVTDNIAIEGVFCSVFSEKTNFSNSTVFFFTEKINFSKSLASRICKKHGYTKVFLRGKDVKFKFYASYLQSDK
jgi:hypothetical protein